MPHPFENLPVLSHSEVLLWNWYCRAAANGSDWKAWLREIFANLVERPAGQQISLIQGHLVDTKYGEKAINFPNKQEMLLGRDADNDIPLPNKAIGEKHARLFVRDGRVYLEDLAGGLGTYLGEKKLRTGEKQAVGNGDVFTIFPYRFQVMIETVWTPETDISISDFRLQPTSRVEFIQTSPPLWRTFIVNVHPEGRKAFLEINPPFLAGLQR